MRHGYARPADQAGLTALMLHAAETTTGCKVRSGMIEGDTGVLRARPDCDGMSGLSEFAPDQ